MTAAVSHPYGVRLFDQHAHLLAESAISVDVATERGYVSVDTKKRLDDLGFTKTAQSIPGLLIPIHGVDGTIRLYQYRPDMPRMAKDGRERKYETPWGKPLAIDVPVRINGTLTDPTIPLWITEGSRKADAAVSAGLTCVALLGVWGWRGTNPSGGKTALADWHSIALNNRDVYIAFDSDVMVKKEVQDALTALAGFLNSRGAHTRLVYLPAAADGTKVGLDDYLAAGGTIDQLYALARDPSQRPLPPAEPATQPVLPEPYKLEQTVDVFRRWLYLDDPAPVYALAGTIVANRAAGDPVWLLIVSAPSTGKTELLSSAARLPYIHSVATLTESSLLSGTSKREHAQDATGGVLRQIGDFGVLLAKDFTSVLAQNRDTRAQALAALREIYDGRWDRPVGTDGGRILSWQGKCGFIGGVTPALDRYHAVVATLGDRFLLLRLPDVDAAKTGTMALNHRGRETQMRTEMADALTGLVQHSDPTKVNRPLIESEVDELVQLATFTARARTGVDRDGYTGEITYLPQVEGPGRLVTAFARLLGGLEAIGCDLDTVWSVLHRIAIDCLPAVRAQLIPHLLDAKVAVRTSEAAMWLGVTTKSAKPYLEDLSLLGLADRTKTSEADNAPDMWSATDWLRDYWPTPKSRKEMYTTPHINSKESSEVTASNGHRSDTETYSWAPFGTSPSHFDEEVCPDCTAPLDSLWHAQRCLGD